jgi:hypothetical protein
MEAVQTCLVSRLKIKRRDTAQDCSYDVLVDISVSLKAGLHD